MRDLKAVETATWEKVLAESVAVAHRDSKRTSATGCLILPLQLKVHTGSSENRSQHRATDSLSAAYALGDRSGIFQSGLDKLRLDIGRKSCASLELV